MKYLYYPLLVLMLFETKVIGQELPCGMRRLFKDGTVLSSTYEAAYHYVENGSVTMKSGFVAKPGFSIKPSLDCNQTKPALEELVIKHAPQIRHAKNENYHLSSVDWYLDRSRLSESKIIRVPYCTTRWGCIPFTSICVYEHTNYQNGIQEISTITSSVNDSNIIQNVNEGNITSITTKSGYYTRSGNKEEASAYVRIRSLDHLNIPAFEGGIEIQYHYFYPWNGDSKEDIIPCTPDADHEGDWESVGVVLDRNYEVLGYTHSVHGDVYFSFASSVNKESQGHPILYSANESHAMYRKTGFNHPSAPFTDRCDNDGYHFDSWNGGKYEIINIDPKISNTAAFPTNPNWINFAGRWGSYPLGPVGPGPNGNKYFWNHDFSGLKWLANFFGVEISDLFEIFNSNQAASSSNARIANGDFSEMQDLLDSINNSNYRFDNIPILEGNEMNIYDGEQPQELADNPNARTLEKDFPILGEECDRLLIENIEEIVLTEEYITNECKVSIEFIESSYVGQLVRWEIASGINTYVFEQHKNTITLDYFLEEETALEISAEYVQSCELMFTGSISLIVPACETSSSNARKRTVDNDQSINIDAGKHKIYPNPTNDKLLIELEKREQEYKNLSVEIYDNLGRKMDDLSLSVISDMKLEIDLGNYQQGLYLIKVLDNHELVLFTRIIKK